MTLRDICILVNKAVANAWFIASTAFYFTGHWIGGTVALAWGIYLLI